MMKLVDYFVVVGYEDQVDSGRHSDLDSYQQGMLQQGSGPHGRGTILQRFPMDLADGAGGQQLGNDDYQEFDNNIHCFCQPDKGWRLYSKQEPPSFFVSVLTDIKVRLWSLCATRCVGLN
jgi:hypothetical protein